MPYSGTIEERREKWNKWYHRDPAHRIHYVRKNGRRRRAIRKQLDDYKRTLVCGRCGENHISCLEFHHIEGETKDFDIGEALRRGLSMQRILRETRKCEVLCSNCHRKLHYEENHGSPVV